MTLKEIKQEIKEVPEILAWFASVRECENIISNFHGKEVGDFVKLMERMNEKSDPNGNVPVIHFVFYHDGNANSYIENKMWTALYDDTWESHVHANVPYIWTDGEFFNHSIARQIKK